MSLSCEPILLGFTGKLPEAPDRLMKRREAEHILCRGAGSCFEKRLHGCHLSRETCFVQGGVSVTVGRMEVGVPRQQELQQREVTFPRGRDQRSRPLCVACFDVGSAVE